MRCASERLIGGVTVLDLASRAMLGELNREVTDKIESLLSAGRRAFLLNLDGVSSLDSNGLGDLAGACESALSRGATVKLVNVHERVAHPLRIMNLAQTFETFENEEQALKSFAPGTPT